LKPNVKLLLIAIVLAVTAIGAWAVIARNTLSPTANSVPIGAGTATLRWLAPAQNEDGSPLTDLAGYVIHCWAASGRRLEPVRVVDPDATSFRVEKLAPGRYSCAVSAVDADGDESELSNMLSASVSP